MRVSRSVMTPNNRKTAAINQHCSLPPLLKIRFPPYPKGLYTFALSQRRKMRKAMWRKPTVAFRKKFEMKRDQKVQIEFDHAVPNFAVRRVEDFFSAWHPNFMSLKEFATSLYLQGISDGFQVGETFTALQLTRKFKGVDSDEYNEVLGPPA